MINKYKSYPPDQLQELASNYIISGWSFSKVDQFARHEKAFEMRYIYNIYGRNSATTVAGSAYHEALEYLDKEKQQGRLLDLVDMEKAAYSYIDGLEANKWKLQKTTPTIEDAKKTATDIATALLKNFARERGTYEDEIAEILHVEFRIDDYVIVNGVHIPLPLTAILDRVVRTKEGKIAIVDFKSRKMFTNEEEKKLKIGTQAITYVIAYETFTGQKVDEVWFIENKYSQNRDGSAQIQKYKLVIDDDTRRLYEALLYEPLQRMLKAVSDPDYVYLINHSDTFVEMAEIYNFWCTTMIAEVGEFDIEPGKKELVAMRLKKIRDASLASVSPQIIRNFKQNASQFISYDLSSKDMTTAEKIEHVLRSFGIHVQVAHQFSGYSSNTYLLEVGGGVKINSIFARRLEIANALNVANVRIAPELKVWEGKSHVAIDFGKKREGTLNFNRSAVVGRKIPIGVDNYGNIIYWDLDNPNTPHIMICGGTGSGKSVSVRNIIECGAIMKFSKIIILDPKNEFPHLSGKNIEVYKEMDDIEAEMQLLVEHMNSLANKGWQEDILVVFDEFADAILNGTKASLLKKMGIKSLEENMRALAQKGRSIGFRIVSAMQRADSKVITGTSKVNFPVQICFRVKSQVDSKVVLDELGAECLSGYGDGLIKSPEFNDTIRFQAYYIDPKSRIGEIGHVITAHHDEEVNATIVQ